MMGFLGDNGYAPTEQIVDVIPGPTPGTVVYVGPTGAKTVMAHSMAKHIMASLAEKARLDLETSSAEEGDARASLEASNKEHQAIYDQAFQLDVQITKKFTMLESTDNISRALRTREELTDLLTKRSKIEDLLQRAKSKVAAGKSEVIQKAKETLEAYKKNDRTRQVSKSPGEFWKIIITDLPQDRKIREMESQIERTESAFGHAVNAIAELDHPLGVGKR